MNDFDLSLELGDLEFMIEEKLTNIKNQMELVKAQDVGLDSRCGKMFICQDGILVEGDTKLIDYYGGFEYINENDKMIIGEYTFYLNQNERVETCVQIWKSKQ